MNPTKTFPITIGTYTALTEENARLRAALESIHAVYCDVEHYRPIEALNQMERIARHALTDTKGNTPA